MGEQIHQVPQNTRVNEAGQGSRQVNSRSAAAVPVIEQEAASQLSMQAMADQSPHVRQLRAYQQMADQGRVTKQTLTSPVQKKANDTGLPDKMKTGMESLSGFSMDQVKVHYNSSQPAQLNAYAYAEGSDIHLGPGQEKHLPHEAWHVVQQAQGRVAPTTHTKTGRAMNDDTLLENEADVMGNRAAAYTAGPAYPVQAKLARPLKSLQITQPKAVQLRAIPLIITDLNVQSAVAMLPLPAYDTAANIIARQTLIDQTRAAFALLNTEVTAELARHPRQVADSSAHISARIAALPGEIATLTTQIDEGAPARQPAKPARAWGGAGLPGGAGAVGPDAYATWLAKNQAIPTKTAERTQKQAEQGTRAADLPIAQLTEACRAVEQKLDNAQASLNTRKKERYFHDLITTTTPVLEVLKAEGTWGFGPSQLGVFNYPMPAVLNGIAKPIQPVSVHIHKPVGARTVNRVHVRGGDFNNTILYSGAAVGPGTIGGWQGTVIQTIFTLI